MQSHFVKTSRVAQSQEGQKRGLLLSTRTALLSELLELSVEVGLGMFGVLGEVAVQILEEKVSTA